MYKPSCEGLSLDGRVVLVRNILLPDQTPMQALQAGCGFALSRGPIDPRGTRSELVGPRPLRGTLTGDARGDTLTPIFGFPRWELLAAGQSPRLAR